MTYTKEQLPWADRLTDLWNSDNVPNWAFNRLNDGQAYGSEHPAVTITLPNYDLFTYTALQKAYVGAPDLRNNSLEALKKKASDSVIAYEKRHNIHAVYANELNTDNKRKLDNSTHALCDIYQATSVEDVVKAMNKWLPNVEYRQLCHISNP